MMQISMRHVVCNVFDVNRHNHGSCDATIALATFAHTRGLSKSSYSVIKVVQIDVLVAYNLDDRRELQRYQNDSLRVHIRVSLTDHVRIDDLHARCLEQRRCTKLLLLMYKESKDRTTYKVFPRNTRESRRIVSKTGMKEVY